MILKLAGSNGSLKMAAGVEGGIKDEPLGCLSTSSLHVSLM